MQQKTLRSFDGTKIAYKVGGCGEKWVVVANGYGGTFSAWTSILEKLQHHYRVLIWDYRGLYHSEVPKNRQSLKVEDHCNDLQCLLKAEGIEKMVLAGWSVGVQIALEHYRKFPETVEQFVFVNGFYGRVLQHSFDGRIAGKLLVPTLRGIKVVAPFLQATLLRSLQPLADSPKGVDLLSRTKVFKGHPEYMQEALSQLVRLDYRIYIQMGLLANKHNTEDVLNSVKVPTLVICGNKDVVAPPRVSRKIADMIPRARYKEISGATHYATFEFPDVIARHMHRFIKESSTNGTSV